MAARRPIGSVGHAIITVTGRPSAPKCTARTWPCMTIPSSRAVALSERIRSPLANVWTLETRASHATLASLASLKTLQARRTDQTAGGTPLGTAPDSSNDCGSSPGLT